MSFKETKQGLDKLKKLGLVDEGNRLSNKLDKLEKENETLKDEIIKRINDLKGIIIV